jgi:hypothetical protein
MRLKSFFAVLALTTIAVYSFAQTSPAPKPIDLLKQKL